MNIDKLIAAIPGMSVAEKADMRTNAIRWAEKGMPEQAAAARLLRALDAHDAPKIEALARRLGDLSIARRVVEAFRVAPMSENERKTIQALLDNPGATTTELSRACGHDSMIWQMHFGNLCKERQTYLWPAAKAEKRDGLFFSGILADIDRATSRFTMKPEVTVAFGELGLKAGPK